MVPTSATPALTRHPSEAGRPERTFRLPVVATALIALGLQLLQACTFGAPAGSLDTPQDMYAVLADAPYVQDSTVSGERWRVIDAAHLKVDHGYTCASTPHAVADDYIGSKLADYAELPPNFDGTVLLNGWSLGYPSSDHHVVGMGAVIFDIVQSGNTLTWHAGGALADHFGDDEYVWCYQYTILAWARNIQPPIGPQKPYVDLQVAHANASGKLVFVDHTLGGSNFTTKNVKFKPRFKPRAKLLAGFGIHFDDDDHHLLQFAFDFGDAAVKNKRIKWRSDVIMKDNSQRDYRFGQVASVIGGESVRIFNPDFVWLQSGSPAAGDYVPNNLHLSQRDDSPNCVQDKEVTEHVYEYVIDDVPYTWAVPMLTGWDLSTACDDEHVKVIGAWIEDFTFTPNTGPGKSTLYYRVRTILQDKQPDRELRDGVQVEILGVNLIQPPGNA